MNLQIVTGPIFYTHCLKCHKRVSNAPSENKDRGVLWADLDGEAFKAYYCSGCVKVLNEEAKP